MSTVKLYTLVYVRKAAYVLLGLKKRGFGVGRWNGFGGKVNTGETIKRAAVRELREECGLQISTDHLKYRGLLEVEFSNESTLMAVNVFTVDKFEGDPKDTEEMEPRWFHKNTLPVSDMWPDNMEWVPHVLQDKDFNARYKYNTEGHLLDKKLQLYNTKTSKNK